MSDTHLTTVEYRDWLKAIKQRLRQAQVKAAVQVNVALLTFYWELGADIVERQKTAKWGTGFLKQLSADLMAEFSDIKGFSHRNIKYIRQWYLFYTEGDSNRATSCGPIVQQPVEQLEGAEKPINVITKFLLELGAGFAYVGRQKELQVGEREFFLDLLFYHTKLHCYVVIELKTGEFEPEYAGKLNFYLKAVDEQLRGDRDEPTIGILLCKTRDRVVVEYALSDILKPMGVSEYQLTRALPDNLKPSLPSIEELEAEFGNPEGGDE